MLGKYTNSLVRMQMARSISIASVSRQDLLDSKDTKWVGQYIKAVSTASESDAQTHAGNIDEYFRKNFRKLNYR
jgi:S-methylmethionine-dependent homocysteine/selenocysteine methylase